jgi:hypothetical protein
MVKIKQRIDIGVDFQDDITASSAIPSIRTTSRLVFLTVEMDHPIATPPGFNVNFCFV